MKPLSLATVLRAGREARGLTQAEAAKKAGIERTYLSCLENGRSVPSLSLIQHLLSLYKLDYSKDEINDMYLSAHKEPCLSNTEVSLVHNFRAKNIAACLRIISQAVPSS